MYLFTRKVFFLVGLTLCVIINVHSQVVTSARNGLWTDAATWIGGQVPTSANATEIIINHDVSIPESILISIRNTVVNGTVSIEPNATVTLDADVLTQKYDLQVFGTLVLQDNATLTGTSITNTSFEDGSRYVHRQGPLGFIPYATWNKNSTFEIAGFKSSGYINIAHSDSWKQIFGNVVYNCPQQTTPFVDLNGYLRSIAGNFVVLNTNNKPLRLSTTQNAVISVGEDFIVEGPSEVWYSMNAMNTVVNIRGDFLYRSTSTGISYLSTKGNITMNVEGEMEMNTPGRIHMASINPDSIGPRQVRLNLNRDLRISSGLLVAPPASGKGTIVFRGTEVQNVLSSPTGSTFQGNLDFVIENSATVSLGNSVLSNQSGSLVVRGKLQVGSSHPGGAIQTGNNGNLYIQNGRIFESGSILEYNGTAAQWIGNGHPAGVNLFCSNAAGVSLLQNLVAGDFILSGSLNAQNFSVTIQGDAIVSAEGHLNSDQINLTGGKRQNINAPGLSVEKVHINKTANSSVTLQSALEVKEYLLIESPNTSFYSNGQLLLSSNTDEGPGTAGVGPLPTGSMIIGDVTVQRFMKGEGRIYRYISSPVQNSTVASLMDDFPITGTFANPSTGQGLVSENPSFYYYDESRGGLADGWVPYPTGGLADANPLIVGKGYAAFIRNGSTATTWDITGLLNQGTISLPVAFTANNAPSNGWNLVGNPYACAIRWDESAMDKWTRENISAVIAIRDNESAGGIFRYWDMDQDYAAIPGGQIASGQSFWVRAMAADPQLIIREGTKTLGGATFFREPQKKIPSFALHLSRGALTDVAYFKIRSAAKEGLDIWDGLKLDNDDFDVSFISADERTLAIQARDKMPCDEVVKIGLQDLTPGACRLVLITKYAFENYTYTVIDKFLKTETLLSADLPYDFQVTSNKESYAFDRLSLRLVGHAPAVDMAVVSRAVACSREAVDILIGNAQAGIVYSAWDEKGRRLSSDTAFVKGDLKISFAADSLLPGQHSIRFTAQSACHVVSLTSSVSILKDASLDVHLESTAPCAGNSAVLTASSNRTDAIFSWFTEENSTDTIGVSNTFETPPLKKPALYFVAASSPSGCFSERYPVQVEVVHYDSARISVKGDTLSSNYVTKNRWMLNGQPILDNLGQHLKLTGPGIYTLEVDTIGCVSRDSFEYFILQSEAATHAPEFYPNPVTDYLFIRHSGAIDHVAIFNTLGARVMERNAGQLILSAPRSEPGIDVSTLPDGIYFAVVTFGLGNNVIRFVKMSR